MQWRLRTLRLGPKMPILVTRTGQAYVFTPELLDQPDAFSQMKPEDIAGVTTDANRLGWGFTVDDDVARRAGEWELEGGKNSNFRELLTVQRVVEEVKKDSSCVGGRKFLFIRTDNTCARHYVNAGTGRRADLWQAGCGEPTKGGFPLKCWDDRPGSRTSKRCPQLCRASNSSPAHLGTLYK